MTTEQLLIGDHYLFATEVINRLNRFYGIPVRVKQHHDDDYFFNNDICWGIITISYLFRKDFHRIFDQIKNKLKNKKEFENYCMLITVSKNDRYFFNFLRRVALIYEMAVYCYRNGRDYFSRAKRCIMWYQDKLYFRSAGSWPSLNKTASFLRILGNPLLRAILEESSLKYPLTFSATVDKIEQRLIKSKNMKSLNGKEFDFFRQQQKKFLTSERDEKESAAFQIEKESAFFQCLKSISLMVDNDTSDQICSMKERRAIIEYMGSLILPEISNKFQNISLSSPESTSSNDLHKPFEKLFQSKQEPDGQETEKENEATSSVFKGLSSQERLSYKNTNEETETSNSEFIAGDFSSSSAFNDKFSQLYSIDDLINDNIFLTKYINLSRKLSRTESILNSSNNMNFLYDRTNSLEMPKNLILPEYSSEGQTVQQCSNENDPLDNSKDLQNSCSSYSASKSELPSSTVDTSKIDFVEQSTISDDKLGIDVSIDDNKEELKMKWGPCIGTFTKGSSILHIQYFPTNFLLTPEQRNTIAQTNIPTDTNTNNSEIDSNTIVDRSPSNSQPQRHRGKRNKRKKRGKRR